MEYRLNSPDVVQEELDGEVIVVHLVSGSYYSLTRSGADVWKRLVADLLAEQLLVPAPGTECRPVVAAASPGERIPFEAPRFERFTDMQELLLVDPIHEVAEAGWPLQPSTPESGAVPQGQVP